MHRALLRLALCTAALVPAFVTASPDLAAQPRPVTRQAPQAPTVDAAAKAALITAFQQRITETYTFPENAAAIAEHLSQQRDAGAYDAITDGAAFAAALTDDIRAFTNDFHFAVRYDPERYALFESMGLGPNPSRYRFTDDLEPRSMPEAGTPEYDQFVEPLRRRNFNLTKIEILDGNVGYLRIETMPPLELARATVDAAITFLAHTDALVIDLRDVPGGTGGFIPYLMSYFFPEGKRLLFTREFAYADTTLSFYTYEALPAPRLDGVPLYVLTSGMTGSAAENLAYTLQQHGRATVVGEATAGAAHSSSMMLLADGFMAQIPIARVVHPVSGANWQGDGVQPDHRTPAEDALYAAHADALQRLLDASEDPRYRPALARYLEAVQAEAEAAARARTGSAQGPDRVRGHLRHTPRLRPGRIAALSAPGRPRHPPRPHRGRPVPVRPRPQHAQPRAPAQPSLRPGCRRPDRAHLCHPRGRERRGCIRQITVKKRRHDDPHAGTTRRRPMTGPAFNGRIDARFLHLTRDDALAEVGQTVEASESIARSGNTGFSTLPHLHFDVAAGCGLPLPACPTTAYGFANTEPHQPPAGTTPRAQ